MLVRKTKPRPVYLTDDQYEAIVEHAKQYGDDYTSFMRRLAMNALKNDRERAMLLASGG